MSEPSATLADTASIAISREEAKIIDEAIRMLRNCHVYAFKDQHDDVRALHGPLLAAIERIESELARAFPEK